MKLTKYKDLRAGREIGLCLIAMVLAVVPGWLARSQGVSTTTVQGTVYLANGQPGAGTLVVSWPAFTTAAGQAVAADSTTVTIAPDGFVSVNLAPNVGATPAGEYYTAIFYLSDETVSTQYWVVPAAAQASLAQVQAQVMPAAQAVQTVSKSYVDQAVQEAAESQLTASGGNLTGPLYLNEDPTQAMQAANKHYVDTAVATAVPLAGGNMTGALGTPAVNGVRAPAAGSGQTTLQAAITAAGTNGAMEIPPTYAGTDTFTNPNGVRVTDLRTSGAQQTERSVKEFGAVCDGVTDDTNALQSALNYANTHGVVLTIPAGKCKTHSLNWHGESIGGLGKQVSALVGFPGQDVLASVTDATNMLSYTRLHDLTIYVDQSLDVSCSTAEARAPAGSCQMSRPVENNSIFSPGGNGLNGTAGTGAAWSVGNCAIAMPAVMGTGGNGLRVAEIENVEIAATGTDPMAAQYPGAHSMHTCGMYLAQWPQWSEFQNIDIRGLNTGIVIPALPVTKPAGLNADSNRWQNITIQATHGFTAAAGSNDVLDNVTGMVGNSAATGEPPTGLVLDLPSGQQGWTVRNAVLMPTWNSVQPALAVTAAGGAVTAVTVGSEHGLGWDPYGTTVPVTFSGSCTAQATAAVNANGAIGSVTVTRGGVGCSATTTASVNTAGTWDTAAPVNLIGGQNMSLFAGNLLKGNGGYTVWNAAGSASYGTQLDGGGGLLPGGGSYAALIENSRPGTTLQVDQFPGADFGAQLQACLSAVSPQYGGDCDARNFTGTLSMGSNLTISTGNTTIQLPCATIATANQIVVTAGTRNVALRGCALRGGSATSGSQGGTVFQYSGTSAMIQVGDPTYATDTPGFHLDNAVINTTGATNATAQGLAAYRTQEMDVESLYFLGNPNQTGMTLDGTGNYTGGTFLDDQFGGFGTAVNAVGHQVANPATTDWMNASAFVRLHIDCPTNNGSPIAGTYGINLQQGDGNTFTGGDVEGCATTLHLGPNAQNNTIVGLRNENSTKQVVADIGSSYNNWITGGTMFTGQLTDNGTRNSFLDAFHRSFNGLNGDWYGSQQDATVTNHYRMGIGTGNERGLLNEYQTDYGYRWTTGLSDATAGEQFYQILDQLNSVNRLSIGQYNNGQFNTNNQTVINAAGTGAVVLNGSNNAGTGGVVIGSGGASEATVATITNAGSAQFNGTLQVGGTSQSAGTMTVRNNADAEVDYYLWPGLTASQKGSFTYKDWNGNSQWYLVKDTSNNWAVNSATGGLDSFKAYQSTNSGDTYINASNSTGHIRLNYEGGSGAETDIYSGSNANLDAAFLGPTSIKFPGLAAGSGRYCLQIDSSGYITNTGAACGTGSESSSGTINSGNNGQIAYYTASGTSIGGMNMIPVTAGGTGATSALAALSSLGAVPLTGGTMTGALTATHFNGPLTGNVTGTASGNLVPANNLNDVASPSAAIQNLLPGVAPDGSLGVTISGNITAGTVSSSDANASSTASEVATIHNVRNAAPRSLIEFGASSSASDNTMAINAALVWERSSPNGCVYVPSGVYKYQTPIAWTFSTELCLLGESLHNTAFYYTGTSDGSSNGNAAFYINYGPSTGFASVRIENIGFAAITTGSTPVQYAFRAVQVGSGTMNNVGFSGGTVSAFEGDFWNGQGDLRNLGVDAGRLPSSIPFSCVNGLTFNSGPLNGTTTALPSSQFTLTMPTVSYCTGIGLNLQSVQGVNVYDGQISSNNQDLYVACKGNGCNRPGVIFDNVMLENSTNPDQAYGNQYFNGLIDSNTINTYGTSIFTNSQMSIAAQSGYSAPYVYNSWPNVVTDNSLDGIRLEHNFSTAVAGTTWGLEQKNFYVVPPSGTACNLGMIHTDYYFKNVGNGTYTISTAPITLNTNGWVAWVKTNLSTGNAYQIVSPAALIELTSASPTFTFSDGSTVTLAQSSSGLTMTVANDSNLVLGTVDVDFYPAGKCGASVPANAAQYAQMVLANGGLSIPTGQSLSLGGSQSVTGLQGSTGSKLLATNGSFTAGDLISTDGSGNAADSGVSASNLVQPVASTVAGDLLCAQAADTTIHPVTITSGSCNGTSCTLNGSSIPVDYQYPSQIVGVKGTSGVTGLNGGPYALSAGSASAISFPFTSASGMPSGGSFYRWCENQTTDDATTPLRFSKNSVNVPANSMVVGINNAHKAMLSFTTTATAPGAAFSMGWVGFSFYNSAGYALLNSSLNGAPGQVTVDFMPLAIGANGLMTTSLESLAWPGGYSNSALTSISGSFQSISTITAKSIGVMTYFQPTGLASITSGSGGTISGTGTCTLSSFSNGGTGATATVTFTTSGSWTGATFSVGTRGYGFTAAPTSATLSSGTATCSGTATLSAVLGGATGNAVDLVSLQ